MKPGQGYQFDWKTLALVLVPVVVLLIIFCIAVSLSEVITKRSSAKKYLADKPVHDFTTAEGVLPVRNLDETIIHHETTAQVTREKTSKQFSFLVYVVHQLY
jgi:hypothetical protein